MPGYKKQKSCEEKHMHIPPLPELAQGKG